jgi:uncharacterized protein (TIGR02996 family)
VTERDALTRAVCAEPGDDTARLVYADWLDENGDPDRAEFIRLQCHLEASDPFAPGRRALLCREWDLLRRHGERWIRKDRLGEGVWAEGLWACPPHTQFRRGFIDRGWFKSPGAFARMAPKLLTRAPVTGIRLWAPYRIRPDRDRWFTNTYYNITHDILRRSHGWFPAQPLRQPGGTEFPEPDEFRRMVESEPFGRLRSFAMDAIYSDRRHLEALAASPAAPRLWELDLSGNPCVAGEAWVVLAEAASLAGLEALSLDGSRLGTDALQALVTSPHLRGLRRFSLSAGNSRVPEALGPGGVRVVCGSRAFPGLRELNLSGQKGGAEGLRALAAWPGLRRLTRLDISYFWREGDDDAEAADAWAAFARSPYWGQLRELNLEGGNLADLEALTDSPNLTTLRVLTFETFADAFSGQDPDGDEAAARLARCPHLADGVEVHLPGKGLTGRGRRLLRDRFGDGLVLYRDDSSPRQPGDWASGRPSRCSFSPEEPYPDYPPGHAG